MDAVRKNECAARPLRNNCPLNTTSPVGRHAEVMEDGTLGGASVVQSAVEDVAVATSEMIPTESGISTVEAGGNDSEGILAPQVKPRCRPLYCC